jgi:choline dehydrogenase-like flavoprotein
MTGNNGVVPVNGDFYLQNALLSPPITLFSRAVAELQVMGGRNMAWDMCVGRGPGNDFMKHLSDSLKIQLLLQKNHSYEIVMEPREC